MPRPSFTSRIIVINLDNTNKKTSLVYDCTDEDVEYIYNTLGLFCCWRCVYWAGYRCILHLHQYSHRLNSFFYLFVRYYSSLYVSSIKFSSSGGYGCIQAAYVTVTLYKSPGGLFYSIFRVLYRNTWIPCNKEPGYHVSYNVYKLHRPAIQFCGDSKSFPNCEPPGCISGQRPHSFVICIYTIKFYSALGRHVH